MKIIFFLACFLSANAQQLSRNLKSHYRNVGLCTRDKKMYTEITFGYWREGGDWDLPEVLQDTIEFREAHNYINYQISLVRNAFKYNDYSCANVVSDVIKNRILLYLYNHKTVLDLFELYSVKMISVSFGGIPLFIIKIYENVYMEI